MREVATALEASDARRFYPPSAAATAVEEAHAPPTPEPAGAGSRRATGAHPGAAATGAVLGAGDHHCQLLPPPAARPRVGTGEDLETTRPSMGPPRAPLLRPR